MKVLSLVILSLVLLGFLVSATQEAVHEAKDKERDYTIYLKSRPFIPAEELSVANATPQHIILQLRDIPSEKEKSMLKEQGITLLTYLPNYAWFAHATEEGLVNLVNQESVRWAGEIQHEDKLKSEDIPAYAREGNNVIRFVQFFEDVPLERASELMEEEKLRVFTEIPLAHGLIVGVPEEKLEDMLSLDEVQYTEIVLGPFKEQLDLSRQRISVNEVQAPPLSLTGTGVKVLVYDGGNIAPHLDYNGRVQVADFCGYSPHTTGIAGIIGGTGSLSSPAGNLRGMATQATMVDHCWSAGLQVWNQTAQLEPHYRNAIQNFLVSVASNSWGVDTGPTTSNPNCALMGDYEAKAYLFDRIVRGDLGRKLQVNFAVGNFNDGLNGNPGCGTNPNPLPPLFRNYGTVPAPAVAKNIMSVGATFDVNNGLTYYSSRGPVDDGRIKPEVVAPGSTITTTNTANGYQNTSGTSFAVPHVAGSSALLFQLWKTRNNNQEPLPSTIKALFVQGAEDMRNPGPDYEVGYGQVNVTASVNLVARSDQNTKHIRESQINHGETHNYYVRVQNADDIKVTIAWDDKEGALNAARNLINDLDLRMTSPTGSIGLPYILDPQNPSNNAVVGEDHVNNVEQIILPLALNGYWKVTLRGTTIPYGPQTYSLASNLPLLEGATLTSAGTPRIGNIVTFNLLDQTGPGSTYVLAMSFTNTGITLSDGRVIPLGLDPLLILTIQAPTAINLLNSIGNLNTLGQSQATWTIPNIPKLVNLRVYAAFVTINPSAPAGIWSISNAVPITIQA